jgi:hypothetical protein
MLDNAPLNGEVVLGKGKDVAMLSKHSVAAKALQFSVSPESDTSLAQVTASTQSSLFSVSIYFCFRWEIF